MQSTAAFRSFALGFVWTAAVSLAPACKQQPSAAPSTPATPAAADTGTAHALAATPPPDAAHAEAPAAPPSASAADARDTPLGAYIHDASQAILHAALAQPVDARWIAHDPAQSIATLSEEARRALGVLGNQLTVTLVEMEIDLVAQPAPGEHHDVMAHAIMLPDGTVRWGTVAGRHDESQLIQPTPGLETSAPPLAASTSRITDALRASCALPWLAPSDVASLPAAIQSEFVADLTSTHAACTQVQGVHGEWRPHVDDIRVLVQGNGHYGYLNSIFDVEGADTPTSRLVLSPLHIELVPEAH